MTAAPENFHEGLPDRRHQTVVAIAATAAAYLLFSIGDACTKLLAEKFHFSQIVVFNCAVIISFMVVYGWVRRGRAAFVVHNPKWVLIRAALSVVVGILNILSLPHITLTTFYTLVFTSPFWVAILSAIFLREKMEKEKIIVIMLCFTVILFMFRPGSGMFNIWSFCVLAGAFLYSASMIVMRYLGPFESRTMIIISGSVLSIIAVAPFLPFYFVMPALSDLGIFLVLGVLSAIGIMCVAFGFQTAPSASTVAPYHYSQMVWGALLGYFMFGEVPDKTTMIGASVIIGAGLYLIWSETRRRAV